MMGEENPVPAESSNCFGGNAGNESESHFHFAPHGIPSPDDLAMRLAIVRCVPLHRPCSHSQTLHRMFTGHSYFFLIIDLWDTHACYKDAMVSP